MYKRLITFNSVIALGISMMSANSINESYVVTTSSIGSSKGITKDISDTISTSLASTSKAIEKAQEVSIEPLEIAENIDLELSYKEINLPKKYEIKKIKAIAWMDKFQPIEITEIKETIIAKNTITKEEIKNDRISTILASNEKSAVEKSKDIITSPGEELLFFDYSKTESHLNENEESVSAKAPVIAQAEEKLPKVAVASPESLEVLSTDELESLVRAGFVGNMKADASRQVNKVVKANEYQVEAKGPKLKIQNLSNEIQTPKIEEFKREVENSLIKDANLKADINSECLDIDKYYKVDKSNQGKYQFELTSIDYSKKEYSNIYGFDMRFFDDNDEIYRDSSSGIIEYKVKLSSEMSNRRMILFAKDHMPLSTDFVYEYGEHRVSFPVFTRDSFSMIVQNLAISDEGANYLVELDEDTEDVELDTQTKYSAKIYLDKNLKVIDRAESEYNYIMFIGVDPGNVEVEFKRNIGKITTKIVHLTEGEIYYDPNFYNIINRDSFKVFKENLLSKCRSILDISKENLSPWSYVGRVNKRSLNEFEINSMVYPFGSRKYYEVKKSGESIYIGRWNSDKVLVPSESYISHVLDQFDFVNKNKCLVQINLRKELKEMFVGGLSVNDSIGTEVMVLDTDGNFYEEPSGNTDKIYLLGEEKGIFNIKLEYIDNSVEYLQSYCSESTFLIEQL